MRPSSGRASGRAALARLAAAVLSLVPVASGAAQAGPCGASYTVRTGDTMGAIATRCATSVEALMQANPQISDPARISIGQEMTVPPAADASNAPDAVAVEWARQRDAAAVPLLAAGRYTVEPGDDMASIATDLGVPLRDLLAANDEVDPFALQPGQVLALPDLEDPEAIEAPPDAAAENGAPASYTVEPGDSLASIAAKSGVPLDALIAANEGVNPRALRPGQSLVLPEVARANEVADPAASGAQSETGAGAGAPTNGEASAETVSGAAPRTVPGTDTDTRESDAPGRYTVEPGDSLAGIAARTGVRLAELMAVNEGVEPRALRPGQELFLPGGARNADAPGGTEDGTDMAAAPGAGGRPATDSEASPTGEAATPVETAAAARPELMRLEGRIRKGVECPVLKTPDGRTYSLVSQAYGFAPGDYVAIEAEPVEVSFCMQGQTVRVTSMKPRPAPQGG